MFVQGMVYHFSPMLFFFFNFFINSKGHVTCNLGIHSVASSALYRYRSVFIPHRSMKIAKLSFNLEAICLHGVVNRHLNVLFCIYVIIQLCLFSAEFFVLFLCLF